VLISKPTIQGQPIQQIELFVVDALRPMETHTSHYCLDDALKDFREFKPKKALIVGMCCPPCRIDLDLTSDR